MLCFRRLYTTVPKHSPAASSTAARASSSPLQVRRRRLRKQPSLQHGTLETSPSESALSLSEKERYQRLKRIGALLKLENGFREPTEEEWLAELNEKRTRIRGTLKRETKDPETGETTIVQDVVGQRIYLPNIIFRMMRNHTPQGQPYNPWEATFRIPHSVTKLDIRSYLHAVYGVKCTYIRTDNYFKPVWRGKPKGSPLSPSGKNRKSYKRAVVGLVEPFYYPEALEDMDHKERQTREAWLEEQFHAKETQEYIQKNQRAMWHGWKSDAIGNRGAILRNVLARRKAREQAVNDGAQALLQARPAAPVAEQADHEPKLHETLHQT